jgi:hypothetical protein
MTADGKDLGEIKEVQTDHYVVEKGLIFEEDFFIPRDAIISVEGDTARVGLNEGDLAGAGWEEPPVYEEVDQLAFRGENINPVTPDPFGVIATPRGEQVEEVGEYVSAPGEEPAVIDGTGNVSRVATVDDLTHPANPASDMDTPRAVNREAAPGEVWQDPSIAEIEPGLNEPNRADLPPAGDFVAPQTSVESPRTGTTVSGTSRSAGASGAGQSYEQRQQPYPGEPNIDFVEGLHVHSADGEDVGKVVTVSPHHVMVEKGRFFKHDYSIPKTAFRERRGDTLYMNVPAVALETADWETGDGDNETIIPIPPRQIGGTGW